MAFDFTGVRKAWGGGIRPRILGYVRGEDQGDIGHATWKEDEIQENDPRYQQMKAQEDQYYENLRYQQEKDEMAKREKQKVIDEENRRNAILSRAFDYNFRKKLGQDGVQADEEVAARMRQTAIETLASDPSVGLDMLKQAKEMTSQVLANRRAQREADLARGTQIGETFGEVNDPVSWAYAKEKLGSLGYVVPKQFQSYSPETQAWADTQQSQSAVQAKAAKLQLDQQKLEAKKAKDAADAEMAQQREERLRAKEQRQQTSADLKERIGKPTTGKGLEEAVASLGGDDRFEDLEDEDKIKAGQDIYPLAVDLLKQNPQWTFDKAREAARDQIYSRIKNGKYNPFSESSEYPNAPPVGTSKGGYRFKGGNPADKNNWEKI